MIRAALISVVLTSFLSPAVAVAEDKPPLVQFKEWLDGLVKPPPPPKPEPVRLGASNTVTLNPLALQHERLGLEYEHAFGTWFSLYGSPQVAYGNAGQSWMLSVGLTLGARFYVLGAAPSGIFFGPEVGLIHERSSSAGQFRRSFNLGFGAGIGWSLVFFDRFVLSVGFAAQYRSIPDPDSPVPDALKVDFSPLPRLAFGVAF